MLPVSVCGDCGAAAGAACASASAGVPAVAARAIAMSGVRILTLPVIDESRSGIAASVPCGKLRTIKKLCDAEGARAPSMGGARARRSDLVLADHFVSGEQKVLRE